MQLKQPYIRKHVHEWELEKQKGPPVACAEKTFKRCSGCPARQSVLTIELYASGFDEPLWPIVDVDWKEDLT